MQFSGIKSQNKNRKVTSYKIPRTARPFDSVIAFAIDAEREKKL
jgi:hypothetical protein